MRRGDPARDAFIRAASQARSAGDPVLLADIALAASTTWISGFDAEAWTQSLLREALSELAGTDPAREVRLLARLATKLFYAEPDESSRCSREAVSISEVLRDDTVSAEALLSQRLSLQREPSASAKGSTSAAGRCNWRATSPARSRCASAASS